MLVAGPVEGPLSSLRGGLARGAWHLAGCARMSEQEKLLVRVTLDQKLRVKINVSKLRTALLTNSYIQRVRLPFYLPS